MPVTIVQTNFTSGEISPKLYGRVDVPRYQNGAKAVRDMIPQIFGGVKRRPGTLFMHEVRDSSKATRLIPFVRNSTAAYELEFSPGYMRVYKDGAIVGAPYEIVSPYTEAQLQEIDYTQGEDTMFLFHQDVAPYKLLCAGDQSWTLAPVTFIELPFEEPGSFPAAELTSGIATPVGGASTMTADAAVFAAGDVGSSIKINGGIVKITGYVSPTEVYGVIKQELLNTVAAPADAWSLHAPAWSASRGYPRTGTLYEQRLITGGSPYFPQTIWGSGTGAYLDFRGGVLDEDGFTFTIASDITNPILYLSSNRALIAMTSGGEFTITGGQERPLAATNVQIKPRTNYGCSTVRPVRVRDTEVFVQRAGRKIRSFGYSLANDDWTGPDLSILAEHLTEGGIADMCWQQEPDSIVWIARNDGGLASITLDRDQEVTAWAYHEGFIGAVESMITTPSADGDQVTMIVRRAIDGQTVRYVERLSDTTLQDCAVVGSGASATVWSGFDHLEGEEVAVTANGSYAGLFPVSSGAITLARAATSIVGGLPYQSRLTMLTPEVQTVGGAASGNAMRTSEISARFFETTGCNVNGKPMVMRRTGSDVLDQAPEAFSGVKRIEAMGWERGESELEFTQDDPMPLHILSVTRKFTVNAG